MSRKLEEALTFKEETGKITKPRVGEVVFNTSTQLMYYIRELKAHKVNDTVYVIPFNMGTEKIGNEYLLDNYLLVEPEDSIKLIPIITENVNEKHAVYTDKLLIDENTHPFNMWLIRFLKERFPGKLITSDRGKCKSILRMVINKPEVPLQHSKIEKLFPLIGTDYKTFLDWISNIKAVKIERREEN